MCVDVQLAGNVIDDFVFPAEVMSAEIEQECLCAISRGSQLQWRNSLASSCRMRRPPLPAR